MSRSARRKLIAAVAVVAIAVGAFALLQGGDDEAAIPGWVDCTMPTVGEEQRTQIDEPLPAVSAELIAELDNASDLATRPDDDALYVAERSGTVYRLLEDEAPEPILTIETTTEQERGLSSITFDPDGTHLYTNATDAEGTNRVLAHPIDDEAVVGEGVEIFSLEQRRINHLLDELVFGDDGYLYLSAGDGGLDPIEGNEEGGAEMGDPQRVAQDLSNLHGKILRIDPDPDEGGYRIPPDNPFVDDPDAAPEVWAYGLRNPWRFSFDRETGDLWLADVGQYCSEEVDMVAADQAAGTNFGWSAYEGYFVHHDDQEPAEHVLPIHAYTRHNGNDTEPAQCAAIGGHVYRGGAIPQLEGAYIFGDYCAGEVRVLRRDDAGAVDVDMLVNVVTAVQSLAEDHDGELYVLTNEGAYRLVPGETTDATTSTTSTTSTASTDPPEAG